MISPRPYQLAGIEKMRAAARQGHRAICLVLPTGSGKTFTATLVVQAHLGRAPINRVLFVAHRSELITQAAETLKRAGLTVRMLLAGKSTGPEDAQVTVASIQTLDTDRWRSRLPDATMVVFDECVAGETMVGDKRADEIRVGDLVPSWDGQRIVNERVTHVFVKEHRGALVTISADGRSLTCTPNHPIWVEGKGYVDAAEVREGDLCRVRCGDEALCARELQANVRRSVRGGAVAIESEAAASGPCMPSVRITDAKAAGDVRPRVSGHGPLSHDGRDESAARVGENDGAEPDVESRDASEGVGDVDGNASPSAGSRWQRVRADDAGVDDDRGSRPRMETDGRTDAHEARDGSAESLQGRRGEPRGDDRCGDRRQVALCDPAPGAGREEDVLSRLARVDRVSIHEPASDRVGAGVRVYNFEVARTHTFFANGLLTHNCHHVKSASWSQLAGHYKGATRIGLTATPERADGSPLGDIFTSIIEVASTRELMELGFLAPCQVFGPVDPSSSLAEDPIEAYVKWLAPQRTIIFTTAVPYSNALAADFVKRGIQAQSVDGSMQTKRRAAILAGFRAGEFPVLINAQLLTEGWDDPGVVGCILTRRPKHAGTYLQMVGRVLRPFPGKDRAILVDLLGAVHDHGMPDAHREFQLEGKTGIAKQQFPTKQCKTCGLLSTGWQGACPNCGFMPTMQIQRVDCDGRGLVDLTTGEPLFETFEDRSDEPMYGPARATRDEMKSCYLSLLASGRGQGFRDGWAWHRYKLVYPDGPNFKATKVREPEPAPDSWQCASCKQPATDRQTWRHADRETICETCFLDAILPSAAPNEAAE